MAFLGALFFGFVPMFMFAAFVNWLDRYEKEPKLLLGAAFMWGVVIAGGGAYILNTAFGCYKDDFSSWMADAYVVKSGDLGELKGEVARVLAKYQQ